MGTRYRNTPTMITTRVTSAAEEADEAARRRAEAMRQRKLREQNPQPREKVFTPQGDQVVVPRGEQAPAPTPQPTAEPGQEMTPKQQALSALTQTNLFGAKEGGLAEQIQQLIKQRRGGGNVADTLGAIQAQIQGLPAFEGTDERISATEQQLAQAQESLGIGAGLPAALLGAAAEFQQDPRDRQQGAQAAVKTLMGMKDKRGKLIQDLQASLTQQEQERLKRVGQFAGLGSGQTGVLQSLLGLAQKDLSNRSAQVNLVGEKRENVMEDLRALIIEPEGVPSEEDIQDIAKAYDADSEDVRRLIPAIQKEVRVKEEQRAQDRAAARRAELGFETPAQKAARQQKEQLAKEQRAQKRATEEQLAEFTKTEKMLDRVEAEMEKAGASVWGEGIGGKVANWWGEVTGMSVPTDKLSSVTVLAAKQINKALEGARPSDLDFLKLEQALPRAGDSNERRRNKLAAVRALYTEIKNGILEGTLDPKDTSSIYDKHLGGVVDVGNVSPEDVADRLGSGEGVEGSFTAMPERVQRDVIKAFAKDVAEDDEGALSRFDNLPEDIQNRVVKELEK